MYHLPATSGSADFLRWDITSFAHHVRRFDSAAIIGVGGGQRHPRRAVFGVSAHHRHRSQRHLRRSPHEAPPVPPLRGSRYARRAFRPRRGEELAGARRRAVRPDPDEPDRHLGGDRSRRLHALGERPLHGRRLGDMTIACVRTELLTVSRWYWPQRPWETGRLLGLALETATAERDARPATPHPARGKRTGSRPSCSAAVRSPPRSCPVPEPRPRRLGFRILRRARGRAGGSRRSPRSLRRRGPTTSAPPFGDSPFDFRPPTDDRPFFFNQLRLDRPIAAFSAVRREWVASASFAETSPRPSRSRGFSFSRRSGSLLTILLPLRLRAAGMSAVPWPWAARPTSASSESGS